MSDSPEKRLIPEGCIVAPGWEIDEPDGTKGPTGELTLILKRKSDCLRVTIGDEGAVFVAVSLGAIINPELKK